MEKKSQLETNSSNSCNKNHILLVYGQYFVFVFIINSRLTHAPISLRSK